MICVLFGYSTTILKVCFAVCNFVQRIYFIVATGAGVHYVPVIYLTQLSRA